MIFRNHRQRLLQPVEHLPQHARAERNREQTAGHFNGIADSDAARVFKHLHVRRIAPNAKHFRHQAFLPHANIPHFIFPNRRIQFDCDETFPHRDDASRRFI